MSQETSNPFRPYPSIRDLTIDQIGQRNQFSKLVLDFFEKKLGSGSKLVKLFKDPDFWSDTSPLSLYHKIELVYKGHSQSPQIKKVRSRVNYDSSSEAGEFSEYSDSSEGSYEEGDVGIENAERITIEGEIAKIVDGFLEPTNYLSKGGFLERNVDPYRYQKFVKIVQLISLYYDDNFDDEKFHALLGKYRMFNVDPAWHEILNAFVDQVNRPECIFNNREEFLIAAWPELADINNLEDFNKLPKADPAWAEEEVERYCSTKIQLKNFYEYLGEENGFRDREHLYNAWDHLEEIKQLCKVTPLEKSDFEKSVKALAEEKFNGKVERTNKDIKKQLEDLKNSFIEASNSEQCESLQEELIQIGERMEDLSKWVNPATQQALLIELPDLQVTYNKLKLFSLIKIQLEKFHQELSEGITFKNEPHYSACFERLKLAKLYQSKLQETKDESANDFLAFSSDDCSSLDNRVFEKIKQDITLAEAKFEEKKNETGREYNGKLDDIEKQLESLVGRFGEADSKQCDLLKGELTQIEKKIKEIVICFNVSEKHSFIDFQKIQKTKDTCRELKTDSEELYGIKIQLENFYTYLDRKSFENRSHYDDCWTHLDEFKRVCESASINSFFKESAKNLAEEKFNEKVKQSVEIRKEKIDPYLKAILEIKIYLGYKKRKMINGGGCTKGLFDFLGSLEKLEGLFINSKTAQWRTKEEQDQTMGENVKGRLVETLVELVNLKMGSSETSEVKSQKEIDSLINKKALELKENNPSNYVVRYFLGVLLDEHRYEKVSDYLLNKVLRESDTSDSFNSNSAVANLLFNSTETKESQKIENDPEQFLLNGRGVFTEPEFGSNRLKTAFNIVKCALDIKEKIKLGKSREVIEEEMDALKVSANSAKADEDKTWSDAIDLVVLECKIAQEAQQIASYLDPAHSLNLNSKYKEIEEKFSEIDSLSYKSLDEVLTKKLEVKGEIEKICSELKSDEAILMQSIQFLKNFDSVLKPFKLELDLETSIGEQDLSNYPAVLVLKRKLEKLRIHYLDNLYEVFQRNLDVYRQANKSLRAIEIKVEAIESNIEAASNIKGVIEGMDLEQLVLKGKENGIYENNLELLNSIKGKSHNTLEEMEAIKQAEEALNKFKNSFDSAREKVIKKQVNKIKGLVDSVDRSTNFSDLFLTRNKLLDEIRLTEGVFLNLSNNACEAEEKLITENKEKMESYLSNSFSTLKEAHDRLLLEVKNTYRKIKDGNVQNFSNEDLSDVGQVDALFSWIEEKKQALEQLFKGINAMDFYNYAEEIVEDDQLHVQIEKLESKIEELAQRELSKMHACISQVWNKHAKDLFVDRLNKVQNAYSAIQRQSNFNRNKSEKENARLEEERVGLRNQLNSLSKRRSVINRSSSAYQASEDQVTERSYFEFNTFKEFKSYLDTCYGRGFRGLPFESCIIELGTLKTAYNRIEKSLYGCELKDSENVYLKKGLRDLKAAKDKSHSIIKKVFTSEITKLVQSISEVDNEANTFDNIMYVAEQLDCVKDEIKELQKVLSKVERTLYNDLFNKLKSKYFLCVKEELIKQIDEVMLKSSSDKKDMIKDWRDEISKQEGWYGLAALFKDKNEYVKKFKKNTGTGLYWFFQGKGKYHTEAEKAFAKVKNTFKELESLSFRYEIEDPLGKIEKEKQEEWLLGEVFNLTLQACINESKGRDISAEEVTQEKMDFKLVLNELMASFSNLPTSKENEANKNNEVIRKDEGDLVQDILPPSQPVTI